MATKSRIHNQILDLYLASIELAETGASTPTDATEPMIVVDLIFDGTDQAIFDALVDMGLTHGAQFGRVISGLFPISQIGALEKMEGLLAAYPAAMATNVGQVTSQGDVAMNADVARADFGVDGTGVTIGILSDSFDRLGGAAQGVANGDLPAAGVTVLEEGPADDATDEGRGMAEIIHDVAPGADLLFHTAFLGQANFAQGIIDLANAGADVIVDDVIYFSEPFFQDGIIAQAVEQVVDAGVVYLSSAGNRADLSYEAAFRPGGLFPEGTAHDFDPGFGVQNNFTFTLNDGDDIQIYLQWDEPFASTAAGAAGAVSDYDIVLVNTANGQVVGSSLVNNVGGNPFEFIDYTNDSGVAQTLALSIYKFSGQNVGVLKLTFQGASSNFQESNGLGPEFSSSTVQGHSNAAGALSVGAAAYFNTPNFGDDPAILNSFSSIGQTPILFDILGNRLAAPILRDSPDFVAPDGVDTSFFGSSDVDSTGFPNFFGTSAAAPHAAAVVALMLEANPDLTPAQVEQIIESTADDMDNPYLFGFQTGTDDATGAGFIRADLAVATAAAGAINITIASADADKLEGDAGTTDYTFTVSRDSTVGVSSADWNVSGADVDGADFGGALPSGNVAFADGEATATITVSVTGDMTFEGDESFTVSLTNPVGGSLGAPSSAQGVIRNDDSEPTDLELAIAASESDLLQGESVELVFALMNLGPDDSENVSVAVSLPAGFAIGSFSAQQGTFDPGTGIWTVGTLGTVSRALSITGTVAAAGDANVSAEVITASPDRDSTPGNNNPAEDDQANLVLNVIDPADNFPTDGSDELLGTNGNDFLDALGGNDTVIARRGDDIVRGGSGNDTLRGGEGNDFLLGNTGDDAIFGNEGDDYLDGDSGSDTLTGGEGADFLAGGSNGDTYAYAPGDGDDTILDSGNSLGDVLDLTGGLTRDDVLIVATGLDGNDALVTFLNGPGQILIRNQFLDGGRYEIEQVRFGNGTTFSVEDLVDPVSVLFPNVVVTVRGTSGDDLLVGTPGADIFYGGPGGDDVFEGLEGDDIYLIAANDGDDTVRDTGPSGDSDTLRFSFEVDPGSITLSRSLLDLDDLTILTGGGNSVLIEGQFDLTGAGVEFIQFDATSTTWDRAAIRQAYLDQVQTDGNDTIDGFRLDDTLEGGTGNDLIRGGEGSDTYLYGIGDGSDTISDTGSPDDVDTVEFLAGLDPDDVTFRRSESNGNDLEIVVGPGGGVITVANQFAGIGAGIEQVRFPDGTVIDRAEILFIVDDSFQEFDIDFDGTAGSDTLTGTPGDDVMRGRAGNDSLFGLAGNDTYLFGNGDGQDVIRDEGSPADSADAIVFGLGISPAGVVPIRSAADPDDLILEIGIAGDRITVDQQFATTGDDIDQIIFDDGTVWTHAFVRQVILDNQTTDGNDTIVGFIYDDSIFGGGGNDTLDGVGGANILDGGTGDDLLIGAIGPDIFIGGTGSDTADVTRSSGNLVVDLGTGSASAGGVSGPALSGIENILAGNGDHSITGSAAGNLIQTGDGNDTLNGEGGDDVLAAGLGANTLDGGAGTDTVRVPFATSAIGEVVVETDRVLVTGPDGQQSEWRNIEFVEFTNATVPIEDIDNIDVGPDLLFNNITVSEPASGFAGALVPVRLSEPTAETVTFQFETVAGTALPVLDFFPRAPTTVTILPGNLTGNFPVVALIPADVLVEGTEFFSFRIFNVVGASLPGGGDEAFVTVTILDSDRGVVFSTSSSEEQVLAPLDGPDFQMPAMGAGETGFITRTGNLPAEKGPTFNIPDQPALNTGGGALDSGGFASSGEDLTQVNVPPVGIGFGGLPAIPASSLGSGLFGYKGLDAVPLQDLGSGALNGFGDVPVYPGADLGAMQSIFGEGSGADFEFIPDTMGLAPLQEQTVFGFKMDMALEQAEALPPAVDFTFLDLDDPVSEFGFDLDPALMV